MYERIRIRSGGYLALCGGYLALMLAISLGAFLDPTLAYSRDPVWMFWSLAACLVALLCRAPFVGVAVGDGRVTRSTWFRSQSWPAAEVAYVSLAGYSGGLNRFSRSGRYLMLAVRLRDGTVVDVPEVAGVRRNMEKRADLLAEALELPRLPLAGRHSA